MSIATEFTETGIRLSDLRPEGGRRVVTVGGTPIMLVRQGDALFAMDSRCPHMGYPLTKATIEDGIMRCHWHHWRFDLASGGCFTAGGDDVPTYDTRIDADGRIAIDPVAHGGTRERLIAHAWTRLEEGIRERRSFLRARSLVQLVESGVSADEIAARAARVALVYHPEGVSSGLVVLTAVLNILEQERSRDQDTEILGLAHGLRHIASDLTARAPKRAEMALPPPYPDTEKLHRWFLTFLEEREPAGAERCLRTLLVQGGTVEDALVWLLDGATAHIFLSTGHVLDFLNKSRELIDHLSDDRALTEEILVGMIRPITDGFRHEEDLDWHDFLPLLEQKTWATSPPLSADLLLGDDARAIVASIRAADASGMNPEDIAAVFAEAAVKRLGRFPVANADDWDAVHHLVTHANGVLGLARHLGHIPEARTPLVQAVLYGALYGYLNRFLNLPRHYLPGEKRAVDTRQEVEQITPRLTSAMANGEVDAAADLAASLAAVSTLRDTEECWAHAVWREDAGFHAHQALDAALSLSRSLAPRLDPKVPVLAGIRFTTAQRDRRLVQWETETALKIAHGEQLVDPE